MNDKISAGEFRESIDRRLSDLKGDPRLAQRIIASEKGEIRVKKISGAAIAVTIILALTMTAAVAAGITGVWKNINWFGEAVREGADSDPLSTVVPSVPGKNDPAATDALVREAMNSAGPRELVVIAAENGVSYAARKQPAGSMEEFAALMEGAPGFPLPRNIPDGWAFSAGSIEFGCLSDGEYILASERIVAEGVTERRYTVDEAHDCVLGYTLRFTGDAGEDITIFAHVQPPRDPGEDIIGVSDDQDARVIRVDGMENGIAVDSDTVHFLFMRKLMEEPLSALIFGSEENWVETYGEYHVRVSSPDVSASDLAAVFGG